MVSTWDKGLGTQDWPAIWVKVVGSGGEVVTEGRWLLTWAGRVQDHPYPPGAVRAETGFENRITSIIFIVRLLHICCGVGWGGNADK